MTPCQISSGVNAIGKYYLNFRSKYNYPGNFSVNGIPRYNLTYEIEIYNPTVICQYALGIFDLLSDKRSEDKVLLEKFIAQSDWLVDNQQKLDHGYGWYLNYDVNIYKIKSPWISALTQGEAISVLSRAYLLSKNNKYLDTAEQAIIPFEYKVSEGGLYNYFNDILIFEEYPCNKPNVVLNGFLFAVFGFYDLYLTNSNQIAKKLFDISLISLEKIINFFDAKFWSQYNLYNYPGTYLASYKYHILHIEQLKALYYLSGKEFLKETYKRWEYYNSRFSSRSKALLWKLTNSNE